MPLLCQPRGPKRESLNERRHALEIGYEGDKGVHVSPGDGNHGHEEDEEVDEDGERDEKRRHQDVRVEKGNDVADDRK
ncbi:hypothetical protein TIFTF001_021598 [Ficus carica]|uniref:Uncharacterized protein n=1 Tax=Ficus carica TaxID=3494 RepID=A0AA88DC14_FICCA|nr:hypothetical protein TIFTF001_021598 [Ficus carica]